MAALVSLADILRCYPDLAPGVVQEHPDVVYCLDKLTTVCDSEPTLAAALEVLTSLAQKCMKVLLSDNNENHFSSLLKRLIRCNFQDIATKAKALIGK